MIELAGMTIRRRVAYSIAAALFVMACGRTELDQPVDEDGGPPGTGQAGHGGTTGAAGRGGTTGAGGNGGSIGGTTGAGAIGGTTGVAGRGGTTGTAGRGGTTGIAGRGGTTGTGAVGGTTGIAGRGGTTGVAGRGGVGGFGAFGGSGGVGGFGAIGGTGGQPPPPPIPCGATVCAPVMEACCVQSSGSTCIPVGKTCPGGATIGCLEGSSCTAGNVCCLSLIGGATTCAPPTVCDFAGGLVLCTSTAQCPSTAPSCCRFGQTGICRPMSCN